MVIINRVGGGGQNFYHGTHTETLYLFNNTSTAEVLMMVQFPSLLVVNFGVGRFLLTKAKVAASLAPPHSILTR